MTWSLHLMKVADDVASLADLQGDGPSPLGHVGDIEERLRATLSLERVGELLVGVVEDAENGFAVEVSFMLDGDVATNGTLRVVPRSRAPSHDQLLVHARTIAAAVGARVFTDDGERIV